MRGALKWQQVAPFCGFPLNPSPNKNLMLFLNQSINLAQNNKKSSQSNTKERMKGCELCPGMARTYCESDQASLCFDCDSRVHAANFLVARHSRVLLCRTCQCPTPWKATGPKLGPAVSVCDTCLAAGRVTSSRKKTELEVGDDDEGESKERDITEQDRENDDVDVSDEDDDVSDDDEEEEEEEEGEEQVVPLTVEAAATPPEASSSSSEDESTTTMSRLKRMRPNVVDPTFSSTFFERNSNRNGLLNPVRVTDDDETTSESFRPVKGRRNSLDSGSRSGGFDLNLMPFGSSHPPI